jgi:protein TonB
VLALAIPGERGGEGSEYDDYLRALRGRIQSSLRYPPAARRRGLSGTVHLELEIEASGTIAQVSLARSSSHRVLDDAALEAVRGLDRVPFPPDLRPRPLRVRLPVVFELR